MMADKGKCDNTHCANVIAVYKTINSELSTKVTDLKIKVKEASRDNIELNRRLMMEREETQKLRAAIISYISSASGGLLRLQQQFCPVSPAEVQNPALNSTSPSLNNRQRSVQSIGKVQPIIKVPGGHIQSLSVSLSRLAPVDSLLEASARDVEPIATGSQQPVRVHSSTRLSGSNADSTLTSFEFDETEDSNLGDAVQPSPTLDQTPPRNLDSDLQPGRRSSENMAVLQTIIEEVGSQLSSMSGTIAGNCSVAANKENTIVSSEAYNIMTSAIRPTTCSTPYANRRTSNMQMSLDLRVVLSPLKNEEIAKYRKQGKRKLNESNNEDEDDDISEDDGGSTTDCSESSAVSAKRGRKRGVLRKSTGRPKRKAAPKELVEVNLRKKLRNTSNSKI